jgi:dienelactone hydrolase
LPYGGRTKAVVLKPQGSTKPLPAILALHDHGGKKYFGYRKIVKLSDHVHPLITEHQVEDYGGKAWANEVARRGYVVLVHDTFTFGSRRVMYEDVQGLDWGDVNTKGKSDEDPEKSENIETYNAWSAAHEHVMSKSLFSAGTTWPGVFLSEDQTALDILEKRKDVDPKRIGCGGLSGGGLRTVYLGGMDPRIKCAVCVGFMTTWTDFIMNKSMTHTWMTYTPLLPNLLDFPEILGLRVPLPTLVQNNNQDELYTLPEMKKADNILREVFKKAGASDKYSAKYYEGRHKFDLNMQADAFDWFDKWLT